MSEARERLIEAVVSPLAGDDELQLIGRQQVGKLIDPAVGESCLDEATERLARPGSRRWRWLGLAVVLVVSLPMIYWALLKGGSGAIGGFRNMDRLVHGEVPDDGTGGSWRAALSEEEELLLFGNPREHGADRWRPLWDFDPRNPAYYQEYVLSYKSEQSDFPEDLIEIGDQIDSGNGWYRMVMAASAVDRLVEVDSLAREEREEGVAKSHDILDPVAFREKVEMFHEGCQSPRLEAYGSDLAKKRFSHLPPSEDMISMIWNLSLVVANQRFDSSFKELALLINAEAQRCQREGDREGFIQLRKSWHRLVTARLDASCNLVDGLISQLLIQTTLPSMRDAAEAVGVDGGHWRSLEEVLRKRKEKISARAIDDHLIDQHGSYLASLILPMIQRMVEEAPPVTAEDLLPSVRVEQALVARILSGMGWLILAVVTLLSLAVTAGVPQAIKPVAKGLQSWLDVSDWLWILLGGVGGPLVLFLGIRYGTPLSRLDWGPRLTLYVVPFSHFVALLLMWLVWPVVIAAWRLEKRGEVFSWRLGKRAFAVLALVAPVLGMVLMGFGVPMGGHTLILMGVVCTLGLVPLIWWIFRPGWGAPRGYGRRLQRAVLQKASRPAWLAAMAGFAVLSPFFEAEERRWLRRDELLRPAPSMTAYEGRVTGILVSELTTLLETHLPEDLSPSE